jgi:2-methylaconitate cis-trans-isomerase PrpF
MALYGTPAALYRGGTSKALMVRSDQLPTQDKAELQDWLLAVFGSPDVRQIDGIGGADVLTSKFAHVGLSRRSDADIDYTFAQVGTDRRWVGWQIMCGNIITAAAPFAMDAGLIEAVATTTKVRIHNVNTGKIVVATVEVTKGVPSTTGSMHIDGVPGTGSPIYLDFTNAVGARTGKLLPTGNRKDRIDVPGMGPLEYSVLDITGTTVFVKASSFGITETEDPMHMLADPELALQAEWLRGTVATQLGLASSPAAASRDFQSPFLIFVGEPADSFIYGTTTLNPASNCDFVGRRPGHKAFPGTGSIPAAVAAALEGTVVHEVTRETAHDHGSYRIGHPSGTIAVDVELDQSGTEVDVRKASLVRTARRLFQGTVYAESSRLPWLEHKLSE